MFAAAVMVLIFPLAVMIIAYRASWRWLVAELVAMGTTVWLFSGGPPSGDVGLLWITLGLGYLPPYAVLCIFVFVRQQERQNRPQHDAKRERHETLSEEAKQAYREGEYQLCLDKLAEARQFGEPDQSARIFEKEARQRLSEAADKNR